MNKIIAFLLAASVAWGQLPVELMGKKVQKYTYYVDAVRGDDSNAGTNPGKPWKTLAKVNASSFTAGQSIGLKAQGNVYRATLTVPSSGNAGSPIVFGSYGGGKAIISGADVVTGWENSWPLTGSVSNTLDSGNLANAWGFRILIAANTFAVNGTSLTITLESASNSQAVIVGAYIGEKAASGDAWDMQAGTISQFLFSGSAGATIPQNTQLTTDELTFAFDKTKNYIISVGVSSGGVKYKVIAGSGNNFKANASAEAGTADVTGYSSGSANWWALQKFTVINATGASQSNTWAATAAVEPFEVWFDNHRGTKQSALASLAANYDYYWSGGRLYVYDGDDSDPDTKYSKVEVAQRAVGIRSSANSYITIDGIQVEKTNYQGIIDAAGDNWTVNNCLVQYLGGGGASGLGHGIYLSGNNGLVANNTVSHVKWYGIAATGSDIIVESNTVTDAWNGAVYPSSIGAGIYAAGLRLVVRYNTVVESNYGIWARSPGGKIYYNIVIDSLVNGFSTDENMLDSGDPVQMDHNTVYHNPRWASGHGMVVQMTGDGVIWRNNIVHVRFTGTNTNVQAYCIQETNYTTIHLDYNLAYKTGGSTADLYKMDDTLYNTLGAWQTALAATPYSGAAAHDVVGDPLFTNAAAADFTLVAGSPAIAAGVYIPGVSISMAPDIGAKQVTR